MKLCHADQTLADKMKQRRDDAQMWARLAQEGEASIFNWGLRLAIATLKEGYGDPFCGDECLDRAKDVLESLLVEVRV